MPPLDMKVKATYRKARRRRARAHMTNILENMRVGATYRKLNPLQKNPCARMHSASQAPSPATVSEVRAAGPDTAVSERT